MNIPKEKYRNIIKGSYERPERYTSKKNNIYEFSYKMCVLNEKGLKDPMRFLFWTFIKMSISGFLKIIFFCRTEKSGINTSILLLL
jgi:hypothetical protein